MHEAVRQYVSEYLPPRYGSVLEVGSLDINGGVRDLLDPDAAYTGVDVQRGPGVDVVADFATYQHDEPVDVVLCLEVFEHTPKWRELIESARRNLKPSGVLIVTCATKGRAPHSAVSESQMQPGEFYANVEHSELDAALAAMFPGFESEVVGLDLRAHAYLQGLPPYAVIIPSKDPEKVCGCVDSLIDTHPEINPDRVVIVSDGLPLRTRWELRGARWVHGVRPFVFPRNVNLGVAATDPGSDIVILGDDVRLDTPGALDKLARESVGAAAVAPIVRGACGQVAQRMGTDAGPDYGAPKWLAFICVYIPRVAWDAVGPLDERFVGYGYDDVDWCLRASKHGPLIVSKRVVVTHLDGSSYRTQPDWTELYAQNRERFEEKWAGCM